MEQKPTPTHQLNNFNITSQTYINELDKIIIKLIKAFSVEHKILIADATEMVRCVLLSRSHNLMSIESEGFAKKYTDHVIDAIKNNTLIYKDSYEFIKLMRLDNV